MDTDSHKKYKYTILHEKKLVMSHQLNMLTIFVSLTTQMGCSNLANTCSKVGDVFSSGLWSESLYCSILVIVSITSRSASPAALEGRPAVPSLALLDESYHSKDPGNDPSGLDFPPPLSISPVASCGYVCPEAWPSKC